jgi:N-methylhydantoinase B/oxoprolinase/acetone carboxylase alpha subunit
MLDPVSIEILWSRITSIVDEAAKVIVRTAFSTLSNEANDFACVLTDEAGNSLAQNTGSIPSFIGTLPATVRHFLAEFPAAEMKDGDVYITNNPWQGTGHLPDVCLVKPVFHRGRLAAFAAACSHVPDIGGMVRSVEPRQVFEEGFHIPLMRFMRDGEPDRSLIKLLRTNVRTPDQTIGDIWALVGAVELMAKRLAATLDEYGLPDVHELADELFARSDQAMRAAIRALPEGSWQYALDTDGLAEPFHFEIRLTIRGGEIAADYAGSSPQQPRAINCPLTYTKAMTAYAIKCALLPNLPNNHGMFRPVEVTAPEGSILNPTFPIAVGGRAATGHYVPVLVFGALAQIMPERVMAAAGSPLWILTLAGRRGGSTFASVLFHNGGLGARADKDGVSCLSWPSNISSTPVEVAERQNPIFFHHKRLRPGSGGDGKYRGGLGQDIAIEIESEEEIQALFVVERTKLAAPGLAGGGPGGRGFVEINGERIDNRRPQFVRHGDTLLIGTPGGGGYGPAGERDPAARERDRRMGYVED